MTVVETGMVVNVSVEEIGSELVSAVIIGATSLTLLDAGGFSEDGGTVLVGDDVTELVGYSALDDDTGIMTLATPLVAAYAANVKVTKYPVSVEKKADVQIDGEGEAVECVVPISLYDRLDEGVRDDATAEQVLIEKPDDSDTFAVVDILGMEPLVDAAFLDPESTAPPEALLDGLPPTTSPTPTVTGVPRLLLVKVDPISNHDPVTYEWHIATGTGSAPSAATLHHEDGSSLTSIETLADGSALDYYATPGDPASGPKLYYVAVVAKDGDGSAPPSPWVECSLDANGTADIAVGAVTAANIEAVLLLASVIKTSAAGRRIEFSSDAGFLVFDSTDNILVQFPTDGTDLLINGDLIAQSLTVVDFLNLTGTNNTIRQGAVVQLESATKKPSAGPTVSTGWPAVVYSTALSTPQNRRGFHLFSGQHWVCHPAFGGNLPRLANYDAATGASLGGGFTVLRAGSGGVAMAPLGAVNIATNWWVLEYDIVTGDHFLVKYNSAGVFQSSTSVTIDASTTRLHTIGTDGTDVYVAQRVSTSDSFFVKRISTTTLLTLGTVTCTSGGTLSTENPTGLYVGNGDYGAFRYVFTTTSGTAAGVRVFNSAGVLQETFKPGFGEIPAGILYDGSVFLSLSRESASRWQYTNIADGVTEIFSTTLYDGVATTHETDMSPTTSKTSVRRKAFLVTGPEIPSGGADDPDRIRIYAGTSAVRTSQWLQATTGVGVRNATIIALATSGTNPPAANGFGAGVAATILASNGDVLLSADDVGWTVYTSTWTSSGTAPNVGTGSITARYQLTKKTVKFEIDVVTAAGGGFAAGTGNYRFLFPPGFAPALTANNPACGYGVINIAGGNYAVTARVFDSTHLQLVQGGSGGGLVTATSPGAVAAGDVFSIRGEYRIL